MPTFLTVAAVDAANPSNLPTPLSSPRNNAPVGAEGGGRLPGNEHRSDIGSESV